MGRGRCLLAVERDRETQRGRGTTLPLPPMLPSPVPPSPAFPGGHEVPRVRACAERWFGPRLSSALPIWSEQEPMADPGPAPPAAVRADTAPSCPSGSPTRSKGSRPGKPGTPALSLPALGPQDAAKASCTGALLASRYSSLLVFLSLLSSFPATGLMSSSLYHISAHPCSARVVSHLNSTLLSPISP